MDVPEQTEPTDLAGYLEAMTKSVFQSGMSYAVVEKKWPGIRRAFADFDPRAVAELTDGDVDRIASDPTVIRNRRKIQATIGNAAVLLDLDEHHRGFRGYLRSHDDFDALVKDLRKQFTFLGDSGCYHFLWTVSEPVPPHEQWVADRPRRPR